MNRAAVASVLLLVAAVGGLWLFGRPAGGAKPLVVAAAAATRPALDPAAAAFTRATGRAVEVRYGGSGDLLAQLRAPGAAPAADVYVPIDESYTREARADGTIEDRTFPVGTLRGLVMLAPGNPKQLAAWADLARPGVRLAVPGAGAGIGKLAREHLGRGGRWEAVRPNVVDTGNVTEAANACQVGAADAAVVWDVVAAMPAYRGHGRLPGDELAGLTARAEAGVVARAADPAAARALAAFLADPAGGRGFFRAAGFGE